MKFVISSNVLFERLQAINKVISSKNTLPILDNFLFDLSDKKLTITASDLESTMITSLDLENAEGEGVIAIPAKRLIDTLKEFSVQPLTFDVNTDTYATVILTQNGKFTITGQNGDDFPTLARLKDDKKSVMVDANILFSGISKTLFAAAEDDLRPIMNGIFMEIYSSGLTFVASDGHKLVRYRRTDVTVEEEGSFVLPQKPATLLKTVLAKEQGTVAVSYDDRNAYFQMANYKMVCRLLEGSYPSYAAVIPNNNPNKMIIDRVEIYTTIKRVAVFSNQASNLIKLQIANNQLIVSAQDIDFSISAFERLNCQYDGDEIEIGFKSQALLDILSNLSSEHVVIELSDPGRAGIILPVEKDIEAEDILMLQMPLQIS
ncbi:MAG TPA: DNA polymerase III subunit beta [Bacteroidales bacterium]|nr:DNA polymerase III subunit beta [Bacteroidales bacterium]